MNQFNLKNRTAIITGGAQGLGLGIAKRFIDSGAEVIIWDIDENILNEAVKALDSKKLSSQIVDVTNFENVKNSINEIIISKKIDIFINNAGVTGLTSG